jgi:hypothetical protein
VREREVHIQYECAHNYYIISSLDFETLARIQSINIPIRHGKCRRSHEIRRKNKSPTTATTVVLDNVCVDGNMSNYYNVLKLVEQ